MSIRCGLSFSKLEEFRAAFGAQASSCFVPYPDEVENGAELELDISVGDARLEVRALVVSADFDESGSVGLRVVLDEPSVQAVNELVKQLDAGAVAPISFSTSRMHIDVSKSSPDVEAVVAPGDELPEQQLEPGTIIDGRFVIESHVATGGMGEVYRAEHIALKRTVAVKVLRRSLITDPEAWTRFEREAQLVSRLESPHVVHVFDFGRTDTGQLFLAMEYVDGETLDVRLGHGPLSPKDAVDILVDAFASPAVNTQVNAALALGMLGKNVGKGKKALEGARTGGDARTRKAVFEALETGKIRPTIDQRFKLAEVQEAHRALEARETTGASVIIP